MKVFVDTNIFLDIALKRKNYQDALVLFKAAKAGLFAGYIADITIVNIDYIARKNMTDVRGFLGIIEENFSILGADNTIIQKALTLHNKDLEDNIQSLLAQQSLCELIITNDQSFVRSDTRTCSSREFVREFMEN